MTLSSWACVEGHWTGTPSPCVTPTGAKYSLPITLNIYDGDDATNELVASKTQTFDVAYRPSANPTKCPKRSDEVVVADREDVLQRSRAGRDVHLRRDDDPSRHGALRDHLPDEPLRVGPDR